MITNNKKYWLRGGLIMILIGIVFYFSPISEYLSLRFPIMFISSSIAYLIVPLYKTLSNTGQFITILLVICGICFIVGAILGAIYGKIKNRKINTQSGFIAQGVIAVIALVLIGGIAYYAGTKKNDNSQIGITIKDPMGGEEVRVGGTQVILFDLAGNIKPEYHVALIAEPGYVPITVIPASQGSYIWTIPEVMCLGGDACMSTQSGEYTIRAELYSEETCVGFCVRNENAKVLGEAKSNTFRITGGASAVPEQTPITIDPLLVNSDPIINSISSDGKIVSNGIVKINGKNLGPCELNSAQSCDINVYIDNNQYSLRGLIVSPSMDSMTFSIKLPTLSIGQHTLYLNYPITNKKDSNVVQFTITN
jgi:hypothetical protein